jgi:hypothetical protein
MAILMEHLENLVKRASMPYDPAATQQTLSAAANMAKPPGAPSMPTMPEPGKDSGNSDATRMAELKFKMEQAQQKLNEKNEKEKVVLQGRLERAQQEIENQKAQRALERQHLSNLEKLRAKEDSLKSKEAEIEHQKVLAQASIAEEQANARAEVAQQRADATAAVAQSQADATASLAEQEAKRYVKTTEDAKKSIDKYRDAQLQTIAGKQQELDNKRNGISPLVQNSISRMQNRVKNMSRIRTKLQAMPGVYMSEVHAGDEPLIQKKADAVLEQNSVANQAKKNPTVQAGQQAAQQTSQAQGSQAPATPSTAQAPTGEQARLDRQKALLESFGDASTALKARREAASFERKESFRQMLTGQATGTTSMLGDLDGLKYKDREVRRAELHRNGQYAKEYAAYLRGDKNINLEGNPFVEMAKNQNLTADEVFTAAQQAQNMAAGWEKDNIAYGKTVEEAAAKDKAKMQELNEHRDMMDKRWDETTQSYKTGYDQLRMTQNDKRYEQDRYWQDKASDAYSNGVWEDLKFTYGNLFTNDSYNQWKARNDYNGDGFMDAMMRSASGTEKDGDMWNLGYYVGAPADWFRKGVAGVAGLFGADTTANRQIWDNQHQRDIAAKRYNADTSWSSNFFETDNPQNKAYYDSLHRKGISGSTWGGVMDQWRGNVMPILNSAMMFGGGGALRSVAKGAAKFAPMLTRPIAGAQKALNYGATTGLISMLGSGAIQLSNGLLGTNFDASGGGLFASPYQQEQLAGVLGTGDLTAQQHYDMQHHMDGVESGMEDQATQYGIPAEQAYQYYGYTNPQQMTKASSTPTTAPSSQNIQLPTAADAANSYRVNTSMDHWAPRETGVLEGLINSYGPTVVGMLGLQPVQLPSAPYQADYTDLHHQTLRGMVNPFASKYLVNRHSSTSDTGRAITNFVRQERQGSGNPMTMCNGAVQGLMGHYNTLY